MPGTGASFIPQMLNRPQKWGSPSTRPPTQIGYQTDEMADKPPPAPWVASRFNSNSASLPLPPAPPQMVGPSQAQAQLQLPTQPAQQHPGPGTGQFHVRGIDLDDRRCRLYSLYRRTRDVRVWLSGILPYLLTACASPFPLAGLILEHGHVAFIFITTL